MVESEVEARPDLIPPILQILQKSDLSNEQKDSAVAVLQVGAVLNYWSNEYQQLTNFNMYLSASKIMLPMSNSTLTKDFEGAATSNLLPSSSSTLSPPLLPAPPLQQPYHQHGGEGRGFVGRGLARPGVGDGLPLHQQRGRMQSLTASIRRQRGLRFNSGQGSLKQKQKSLEINLNARR